MSTRFTALEIGSGDAFLLEDEGKTILFDSGGSKNRIKELLKDREIERIDLAICSHNDGDHANGFIGLLKSYQFIIDEIWLPYWWASILQYANENEINWEEVEKISHEINDKNIKDFNPELLYSDEHEPLSDDAFGSVLSNLAERMGNKNLTPTSYRIFYDFAHAIAHNMIDRLAHDTRHDFYTDLDTDVAHIIAHDVAHDVVYFVADYVAYRVADYAAHRVADHITHDEFYTLRRDIDRYLLSHLDEFLPSNSFNHLMTANSGSNIRIMFNNIMEIAVLAYKCGCRIKWFEPTTDCTLFHVPGTHFLALNSTLKRQVKKLKNTYAFALALHLTVENEYSLAFEYLKDDIPIIRFSADSNCTCRSSEYNNSIIITAPHHGSDANANVYNAIDPKNQDHVIWVRSDALYRTQGRPCGDFKLRNNKYCLACKKRIPYNKFEVCFEYDNLIQQWRLNHGYPCIC